MDIYDFVLRKFTDKFDKAGKPYFSHLKRVANTSYNTEWSSYEEREMLYDIGLLHDIFEDTDATEDDLKELKYITQQIIDVVKILTRDKEKETYFEYIERVSKNKYATLVKMADLKDNMDITRYDKLDENVFSLLKRYHKAYKILYTSYLKTI